MDKHNFTRVTQHNKLTIAIYIDRQSMDKQGYPMFIIVYHVIISLGLPLFIVSLPCLLFGD